MADVPLLRARHAALLLSVEDPDGEVKVFGELDFGRGTLAGVVGGEVVVEGGSEFVTLGETERERSAVFTEGSC